MGILVVFLAISIFITKIWLGWYTNHGQQLIVPNFVDMDFDEAMKLAEEKSFRLVVADSVFLVNHPPQRVLVQDPPERFKVKEGRKIYVTITKVVPDLVALPDLKGGNDDFIQYQRKLKRLGVESRVVDRKYSIKLERNTILDILVDGRKVTDKVQDGFKVPMGSTVEFVVSDRGGGTVEIPNLVCKNFDASKFLIQNFNLKIGRVELGPDVKSEASAYVAKQYPNYRSGSKMEIGAPIDVTLSISPPKSCGGDDYGAKKDTLN